MPVPEEWINRYLVRVLKGRTSPSDPSYIRHDALRTIIPKLIEIGIRRMNTLPERDPFWEGTNREPTIYKLPDYCVRSVRRNESDTEAQRILFACEFFSGENGLGARHLVPLVKRDITELPWLCLVAQHAEDEGVFGLDALSEALNTLNTEVPHFIEQLQELSGDEATQMGQAARVALRVLNGENPFSQKQTEEGGAG